MYIYIYIYIYIYLYKYSAKILDSDPFRNDPVPVQQKN